MRGLVGPIEAVQRRDQSQLQREDDTAAPSQMLRPRFRKHGPTPAKPVASPPLDQHQQRHPKHDRTDEKTHNRKSHHPPQAYPGYR